jgi:hypothetical protein
MHFALGFHFLSLMVDTEHRTETDPPEELHKKLEAKLSSQSRKTVSNWNDQVALGCHTKPRHIEGSKSPI